MEGGRARRRSGVAGQDVGRHGIAVPRGQRGETRGEPGPGRFGWMFPRRTPCEAGEDALEALAELMKPRGQTLDQNLGLPAGYTYLGQFIDHDITFDPTSVHDRHADPDARENFRTPRFDLDSLYGSGRVVHPFLYDWKESGPAGVKLLVGHNAFDATDDLPRNQQGRAVIGDARNDENVILAQLHLLFIRFHNAVVDHLSVRGVPDDELLDRARELVRWHYQWIVVHEFLPKIVGDELWRRVYTPGTKDSAPTVRREFFKWRRQPFIPYEFSGAAYRFGHSMVRDRYGIKRLPEERRRDRVTADPTIPFAELGGFRWLRRDLVIAWERYFEFEPRQVQSSFAIDTRISEPLFSLPEDGSNLPLRNLLRGHRLGLPSGQAIARRMRAPLLTPEQLRLDGIDKRFQRVLERSTPLWYYVLCEAESEHGLAGRQLGPVGGRIVAEVLAGLLDGDPSSFMNQEKPGWRPGALETGDSFHMTDLIEFARQAA